MSNENKKQPKQTSSGLWARLFKRESILGTLLTMLAISVVLFFIILYGLQWYTNHGEMVRVPDIRGKVLADAVAQLEQEGLRYEVVDSIYEKGATPGGIIDVVPTPGENVKPGRIIFLKIWASSPRKLSIPHVENMSVRQVLTLLKAIGFERITQRVVPGEYLDLCQGLTDASGRRLKAGDLISKDTPIIVLVTGHIQDTISVDSLIMDVPNDSIAKHDTTARRHKPKPQEQPTNNPENWW